MRYKVGDIVVLKRKHDMYRGSNIVRINSKSFSLYFSDQVIGEVFDDKYIDHEETAELLKKDVGGMGMKDLEWLKEVMLEAKIELLAKQTFGGYENGYMDAITLFEDAVDDVSQVEQPELPVIPERVASFLENRKKDGGNLFIALDMVKEDCDLELMNWFYYNKEMALSESIETFTRAWLDGYTVEEKKYAVAVDHDNGDWTYASDGRNIFKTRFKSDATQLAKLLGGRVIRYEEGE